MQAAQALGAACRGGSDARQALGEGLPGAARSRAAEPPRLDAQGDGAALPGQVAKVALVTAVDTAGQSAAVRAGRCGRARLGDDGDAVRGGQDLDDGQARRGQGQQTLGQGRLPTQEECSSYVRTQTRNGDRLHGNCGRTQNGPVCARVATGQTPALVC